MSERMPTAEHAALSFLPLLGMQVEPQLGHLQAVVGWVPGLRFEIAGAAATAALPCPEQQAW